MGYLENLKNKISARSGQGLLEEYSKPKKKKVVVAAKEPRADDFDMDGNKTEKVRGKQSWEIAAEKKAEAKKQAGMTKAERRSAAMARK